MLFSINVYKYIVLCWFWNQGMEVGVAFFIIIPNKPFTELLILIWQLFFSVGLKNLVSKKSLVSKLPRKFPQTENVLLNLKIRLPLVFVVFLHQPLNEQTGRSYFTQWDDWFPLLIRHSVIAKRNGQTRLYELPGNFSRIFVNTPMPNHKEQPQNAGYFRTQLFRRRIWRHFTRQSTPA